MLDKKNNLELSVIVQFLMLIASCEDKGRYTKIVLFRVE